VKDENILHFFFSFSESKEGFLLSFQGILLNLYTHFFCKGHGLVIEVNNLSKTYTSYGKVKVPALKDFSLSVNSSSIFGLLGPNGAGKTTLVKILLGITFPTSGSAKILGSDISDYQIRRRIGYLPENHKFPLYLNGEEVLRYFGRLAGADDTKINSKIDELLSLVKLLTWKKRKIKTYSKGMMQRLGIAQALINDPELIFLDEPTDGVDPIGRVEIREILKNLKDSGKTIFLNSHLLSETEMICDRVGILNKGQLIKEGTVSELTETKEEYTIRTVNEIPAGILPGIVNKTQGEYNFSVGDISELNNKIDLLRQNGVFIKEIIQQKNSLESMFVQLIQKVDKGDSI
jgi:ABC-2 type transport system ATP-binding protein